MNRLIPILALTIHVFDLISFDSVGPVIVLGFPINRPMGSLMRIERTALFRVESTHFERLSSHRFHYNNQFYPVLSLRNNNNNNKQEELSCITMHHHDPLSHHHPSPCITMTQYLITMHHHPSP
jgi:hypothetical protein